MSDELQELIRQYTGNEQATVTGEMILVTDIGLNSIELIELLCEVEQKFNIDIPDRALNRFKTVQDVLDYIVAQA